MITPSYNCAKFLPETVESVVSQDYDNLEYLVLDDGSTDNTIDVLQKYEIYHISDKVTGYYHPNMGEQRTVNRGLLMARGKYFMVVNYLKPVIAPDLKVYTCCGAQYALEQPIRDMPLALSLGMAKDMRKIIAQSGKPFDGSKCVKCYYSNYNDLLHSLLKDIKHQEFV